MVTLKNGSEIPSIAVATTMMNLEQLMKTDSVAFYELVQKCRNSNHTMWGNSSNTAESWGLMASGRVSGAVSDIVLSAVNGDDLDMTLESPIAEKNNLSNRR